MSGIDRQLEQMFLAERRRIASILNDAASLNDDGSLTIEDALTIAARHVEYGDEHGTLYAECGRCRDYHGTKRRTEVTFGHTSVPCGECGASIDFVR